MTITYRTIKGSELTYAEVDENFATITAQYDSVVAAVGDVNQSAANAANSAAAAAASETSASNSASSATASKVAVTDLYDQFDDRYLGSKDSAPTLDNDGNALLTGALYWNSVSNKMFVWTGSMWADVVAANASTVQFSPTGTGAVTTDVQTKLSEYLSVKDFGAVGNGSTDDTAAIQAAIDAAIAQRKSLYFPRTNLGSLGLYKITAPLTISAGIRIFGDGISYSGLLCSNCSGFRIAAGVNFVTIEKLAIVQATRYSVSANTHKAIETLGTTDNYNFWHIYRDLFIDGFEWAMKLSFTWSALVNSVTSVYGFGGIDAPGKSVNNFVSNCSLGGSKTAGSVGIRIGDGITATEGWMIQDCLLSNFAVGVHGICANNCQVRGCIIDFFQQRGVLLESTANGGSTNWIIADNYMATDSGAASTGVYLLNSFAASAAQHRGTVVSNNQILEYSGASLAHGILQAGTAEDNNIISGNRVAASTYACRISAGTRTVVCNNRWKTGTFAADVLVNYYGNEGTIATTIANLKQSNGNKDFYYNSAAPTSGTFMQGDIVWFSGPTAGSNIGWVCVASGTPGTWVPFGGVQTANAYTVTNPTTDRALDVTVDTLPQVAAVLGTLIADLKASGVLK